MILFCLLTAFQEVESPKLAPAYHLLFTFRSQLWPPGDPVREKSYRDLRALKITALISEPRFPIRKRMPGLLFHYYCCCSTTAAKAELSFLLVFGFFFFLNTTATSLTAKK